MYEWDDEFYNEPSGFDIQVDAFKQTLLNTVKDEYKAEMEQLRKENAELQDVKMRMVEIEKEHNQKMYEIDRMKTNLKMEVRRERLKELMGDFRVELFRAYSRNRKPQKCDKCDEYRRIWYKTPSGKNAYEECECAKGAVYFEPSGMMCSSFEVRNGNFVAWYKELDGNEDGMKFAFDADSRVPKNIYSGQDFSEIESHYDMYFKNKDECQAYCDWLTAAANKEATHG